MPLKITLKPGERVILDGAVIRNGKIKAELTIENTVPVLRQKDVLSEEDADTICRQIYFVIQLMYLDRADTAVHHRTYWNLVHPLVEAVPSAITLVDQISDHILNNRYYRALKLAKKLIVYEEEVMNRV